MAQTSSPSFPLKDSSISSAPPPVTPSVAMPDAKTSRDPQGHFTQAFKLDAVRYAAACAQRATMPAPGSGSV